VGSEQMAWTIDVCRACGRLATWPFCEHRDQGAGWCVPVQVRPIHPKRAAKLIREASGGE
jgi:hypothetical protein